MEIKARFRSEHQEYFWIDHFKPGSLYPSLVCQRRFPDIIVSDQLTVIAIKNQKLCLTCRLNIRNNSGRARMHLGTRVIKLCIKYKRYLTCLSHGCVFVQSWPHINLTNLGYTSLHFCPSWPTWMTTIVAITFCPCWFYLDCNVEEEAFRCIINPGKINIVNRIVTLHQTFFFACFISIYIYSLLLKRAC